MEVGTLFDRRRLYVCMKDLIMEAELNLWIENYIMEVKLNLWIKNYVMESGT